jgi:hypothetical protein
MTVIERIERPGKKKLLAIDGGGIRGVLALEILERVENLLGASDGSFRLSHYFDYIAGTSTGGIIAAGLSMGMSVGEIKQFYEEAGPQMFVRANLLQRLRYKYDDEPLALMLRQVFGHDTCLGSDRLQTLLLLVVRNATTDSPWPLSNNPYAKYNMASHPDNNLNLPLWQLIRASTAAPTYFPPEVIVFSGRAAERVFVDGGITMYNNPAFQMFLMATVDRYWTQKPSARWKAGAENMLILSIGTGTSPGTQSELGPRQMNLLFNATTIPAALMFAALNEQDLLCRVFGDCRAGDRLDGEVEDVIGSVGPLEREQKLFSYVRYNTELSRAGLDAIDCKDIQPDQVQALDSISSVPLLREVGLKVAEKKVALSHFAEFYNDQELRTS